MRRLSFCWTFAIQITIDMSPKFGDTHPQASQSDTRVKNDTVQSAVSLFELSKRIVGSFFLQSADTVVI